MDPNHLLAQNQVKMPALQGPGPAVTSGDASVMEKIISSSIGVLTIVAVIYFAIQIILAGYAFITAQGDEKLMITARKRLTDGVLGLTIVIVSMGLAALIASLLGIENAFDLNGVLNSLTF